MLTLTRPCIRLTDRLSAEVQEDWASYWLRLQLTKQPVDAVTYFLRTCQELTMLTWSDDELRYLPRENYAVTVMYVTENVVPAFTSGPGFTTPKARDLLLLYTEQYVEPLPGWDMIQYEYSRLHSVSVWGRFSCPSDLHTPMLIVPLPVSGHRYRVTLNPQTRSLIYTRL